MNELGIVNSYFFFVRDDDGEMVPLTSVSGKNHTRHLVTYPLKKLNISHRIMEKLTLRPKNAVLIYNVKDHELTFEFKISTDHKNCDRSKFQIWAAIPESERFLDNFHSAPLEDLNVKWYHNIPDKCRCDELKCETRMTAELSDYLHSEQLKNFFDFIERKTVK